MSVKTCSKCGETKSVAEFSRRSRSPDGLEWSCKSCIRAYRKQHRHSNPAYVAQHNAYTREWRERNKDSLPLKYRDYRERNKDKRLRATNAWRERNKDRIKEWQRDYNERNRERLRALAKERWATEKDRRLAQKAEQRASLSDQYVTTLICQRDCIPRDAVPQPLIEAKRVQLQIKRFLKEQMK